MKLIAIKDISPQLPAGATFERPSAHDGNILIALGLARDASDPEPPTSTPDTVPAASRRRSRYRTRALQAGV